MKKEDSGLVLRGLILFGVIGSLVAVLLFILLYRPSQELPKQSLNPELAVTYLVQPATAFPAAIAWPALWELQRTLPSSDGWQIRYNACEALARRGSQAVPWNVMAEMLDEDRQMRNFREKLASGQDVPDETAARSVLVSALDSLSEWHKKQDPATKASPELQEVYAAVDRLAAMRS